MQPPTEMSRLNERGSGADAALCRHLGDILHLREIVRTGRLTAVFQPIVDLQQAQVIGYEGLIRGPTDSLLHSPATLFRTARDCGMIAEVEQRSRRVVLESFAGLGLPGKLFVNASPDLFLEPALHADHTRTVITRLGLEPSQVVIEITENIPTVDYHRLRDTTQQYQRRGFEIAIDDLGEGFSGLRLWSEIRPNYVKIDQHFIRDIHRDPVKLQFVRALQEIGAKVGTRVIAEGIESDAELTVIRDLGIAYGQGYCIAKPSAAPLRAVSAALRRSLRRAKGACDRNLTRSGCVEQLLKRTPTVAPMCPNETVFKLFEQDAALYSIPVTVDGHPVGLISRYAMIEGFARPYHRELYGRRPCQSIMDRSPLVVEKSLSVDDLSNLILQRDPHYLAVGYIITDHGRYLGMGSEHDLLRLIAQRQRGAVRDEPALTPPSGHALPLTQQFNSLLPPCPSFIRCGGDLDQFRSFDASLGVVPSAVGAVALDSRGESTPAAAGTPPRRRPASATSPGRVYG